MNALFVLLLLASYGVVCEKARRRPTELTNNDIDENFGPKNLSTAIKPKSQVLNWTTLDPFTGKKRKQQQTRLNENGGNREKTTLSPSTDGGTRETTGIVPSTTAPSSYTRQFGESSKEVTSSSFSEYTTLTVFETTTPSDATTGSAEVTTETTATLFTEPTTTTQIPCPDNLTISSLTVNADSFEAVVSWDPPDNVACVENYAVYLDDDIHIETSEKETTITGLNACQEYTVGVEIFNGDIWGTRVNMTFHTTPPRPFSYSVGKITFDESDGVLNVTWEPPPEKVIKCVTDYSVHGWDESGFITIDTSTINTFTEIKLIGCVHFVVMITPNVNASLVGNNINANYTVGPIVTSAPKIIGDTETDKTSVKITWQTDTKKENQCQLEKIIGHCIANSDEEWAVKEKEEELDISGGSINFRFPMTIDGLSPFTEYQCWAVVVNTAGNSTPHNFSFKTDEDVPSSPKSVTAHDIGSYEFTISWSIPQKVPGVLISYTLTIENKGAAFKPNDNCFENAPFFTYFHNPDPYVTNKFQYALPYHNYYVEVYATDGAGNSSTSAINVTTTAAKPENVTNVTLSNVVYSNTEEYFANTTIEFEPSCTHGPFKYYQIDYRGQREGFPDDERTIPTTDTKIQLSLQPEREYYIAVAVVTENNLSSTFVLPKLEKTRPGVPILDGDIIKPVCNETTRAYFTLLKSVFDNSNGEILYYALILLPKTEETVWRNYGFWNGTEETWPSLPSGALHQLTPKFWKPFENESDASIFIIGGGTCEEDDFCNGPLTEDTEYSLIVRALTSATYKDSPLIDFKTSVLDNVNLGLIFGLVFGLLAAAILVIFIIILLRRRKKGFLEEKLRHFSVSSPESITCKKFPEYYDNIKENSNIIKSQYASLANVNKELGLSTSYALLLENKRKNRYTNILPYDETRVKLNIDEDDEIGSDYINASYIKGFSNRIEYIATQGPLESTCKDFWKMIMQENVSVIVMVSQFVEQSKEKCFQYFPNNHEKVSFGEFLEIRCSTELHFGTYCVRTFQVRKDTEQRTVYHMQFLEWPDFGVPLSTDTMLEFCHQVREKVEAEGGLIVVHCSAGVGRTGTLIALDILLQAINHHRDINIYKTVLDLRKQRINMVQTEKQYFFIHTCVKEYLEASPVQANEQMQERTYENVDMLRSSLKKNLIDAEIESAL